MARTKRIKSDRSACYHVMSRIVGEYYLLKTDEAKEALLDSLHRAAVFSGVDVAGFCIMDNHFHVCCQLPKRDPGAVPDEEVLRRAEYVKGRDGFRRLMVELDALRASGDIDGYNARLRALRARMYDISQFVKTFLEVFSRRFREQTGYVGRLWGDRFKSVLMKDTAQFRRCLKYIALNPVRAGMVNRIVAYAWNTQGAARRGDEFAKRCLAWGMAFAGGDCPVEVWMLRRCVQMSAGKILGSAAFVEEAIARYGAGLRSGRLRARLVVDGMYSSHGHRLAKKAMAEA